MISDSLGRRAQFFIVFREAGRSAPMMASDRSTVSRSAIFFFVILIGIPSAARSATLEDSAKELARKITAVLPAGAMASCEFRNISSLRPGEVAQIEQALNAELQDREARLSEPSVAPVAVSITLSESFRNYVWTAGFSLSDTPHVILMAVERSSENRDLPNSMLVTMRSEKFWEGPERILDATETSNRAGRSWLVLLLPASLAIQDLPAGTIGKVDIVPAPLNIRDPWGRLETDPAGNSIWFSIAAQLCKVDLEARSSPECQSSTELNTPASPNFRTLTDLAPSASPLPGRGMELVIAPVCGGTNQFLATSARDYTQTDSLQLFQLEPNGPAAASAEMDFPGPIVALHMALDAPRAIVRNLTTGNYEAYRLSFTCGP